MTQPDPNSETNASDASANATDQGAPVRRAMTLPAPWHSLVQLAFPPGLEGVADGDTAGTVVAPDDPRPYYDDLRQVTKVIELPGGTKLHLTASLTSGQGNYHGGLEIYNAGSDASAESDPIDDFGADSVLVIDTKVLGVDEPPVEIYFAFEGETPSEGDITEGRRVFWTDPEPDEDARTSSVAHVTCPQRENGQLGVFFVETPSYSLIELDAESLGELTLLDEVRGHNGEIFQAGEPVAA